ncbi:hypothetical protein P280DRAFT_550812 [Massarina eburnea CBS 473.64]|uniref:Uncharacterized protein n=1 Tax=Massarina eburnea CBS 473.64 TaxID=1395130 RepID=A0A6A6RVM6_9PLEO|nr:hypothetical protein P280DRAFT_550812 [Massarina eburnea CBS 473.64]
MPSSNRSTPPVSYDNDYLRHCRNVAAQQARYDREDDELVADVDRAMKGPSTHTNNVQGKLDTIYEMASDLPVSTQDASVLTPCSTSRPATGHPTSARPAEIHESIRLPVSETFLQRCRDPEHIRVFVHHPTWNAALEVNVSPGSTPNNETSVYLQKPEIVPIYGETVTNPTYTIEPQVYPSYEDLPTKNRRNTSNVRDPELFFDHDPCVTASSITPTNRMNTVQNSGQMARHPESPVTDSVNHTILELSGHPVTTGPVERLELGPVVRPMDLDAAGPRESFPSPIRTVGEPTLAEPEQAPQLASIGESKSLLEDQDLAPYITADTNDLGRFEEKMPTATKIVKGNSRKKME